jgi:hypothetical protein
MNARLEGGIWSALTRAPHAMGVHLRSALHNTVVLIGTSSAANVPGRPWVPDEGNVDSALARVGLPQFLLDLRHAPTRRPREDAAAINISGSDNHPTCRHTTTTGRPQFVGQEGNAIRLVASRGPSPWRESPLQ